MQTIDELICPVCNSDEIHFGRFSPKGVKPWYCSDCGFSSDTKDIFAKPQTRVVSNTLISKSDIRNIVQKDEYINNKYNECVFFNLFIETILSLRSKKENNIYLRDLLKAISILIDSQVSPKQ